MLMYNIIKYSDNYEKTSESLWQYCKNNPSHSITDCESFKFKSKQTNNINNTGNANVEIPVAWKHFSNFWRALEVLLIGPPSYGGSYKIAIVCLSFCPLVCLCLFV